MGWFDDSFPGHEGHLVAFIMRKPESYAWRELAYPDDDTELAEIRWVAVACICGWRSHRMKAPQGTRWLPFAVVLPFETRDDGARKLWRLHCESMRGVPVENGVAGSLSDVAETMLRSRPRPRVT